MRLRLKATHVVLGMLCVMYFITYVDRVNIGTAASEIQKELHLSNTQLGLVFSAFAYPYLLFQVIGGWVGDHFGPRRTLFWCGLIWAASTIMTGFVTGLTTLFNLIYLVQMMWQGYGLQLYAAVAVIFGVYIALHQWKMQQSL